MNTIPRVVITGVGVISSLGDSLAQLHSALCAGQSRIEAVELFDAATLICRFGGEVKSFEAQRYLGKINLRPLDRTGRFAACAARLALDDSGWSSETLEQAKPGLVLGTMFGSVHTISEFDRRALQAGPVYASPMDFANTVINAAAGQTAIIHKLRGVNSTISTGPTSGLQAVAYATDLIRSGRAAAVLAGGAEELCFESFYNFDRAGLLSAHNHDRRPIPFHAARDGFVLGEGAALLMLEDEESARRRGVHPLAEISGHASGYDPSLGNNSTNVIARTIELAVADAGITTDEIDCVSASANGSVAWDAAEARALVKVFNGRAQRVPVTAIKSMIGETLGASGALQIAAMIGTMHDGVLPSIRGFEQSDNHCPLPALTAGNQQIEARVGLINSIGFDGQCCSLVLGKYTDS